MNSSLLLLQHYSLAIELDKKELALYAYDYKEDILQSHTKGQLTAINEDIRDLIVSHFNISLDAYGIEVINDVLSYTRA